jgi:hypothetical protein
MCVLQKKAMIVNLTIRQWQGKKTDKKVTAKVESDYQAKNAGQYRKNLVAEEKIKEVTKAASSIRSFFYENTLAWGNNGDRLLPTANYLDFITKLMTLKGEFETVVADFVLEYPSLRDEAKIRLNGMFDDADYPSLSTIAKKFAIETDIRPVENSADFRVEIAEEEIQSIRAEIEQKNDARMQEATESLIQRLNDAIFHLYEKASLPDAIFRDSLVGNLRELATLAPKLNFTNDHRVTRLVEAARALSAHEAQDLRDNPELRKHTALAAANVLGLYNNNLTNS